MPGKARTSGAKPNIPSSPATTVAKLLERNSWRGTCEAAHSADSAHGAINRLTVRGCFETQPCGWWALVYW